MNYGRGLLVYSSLYISGFSHYMIVSVGIRDVAVASELSDV